MATDSPTAEAPPQVESPDELNADALREAMVLRENLKRLQAMGGVESNIRNMEAEDEAIRRDLEYGQRFLLGDVVKSELGSDNMRAMSARDTIININRPQETPTQATEPKTQSPPPAPVSPATEPQVASPMQTAGGLSKMAIVAMLGSAALGGGGLAAALTSYFNAPVVQQVGTDRQYGIKGFVDQLE